MGRQRSFERVAKESVKEERLGGKWFKERLRN